MVKVKVFRRIFGEQKVTTGLVLCLGLALAISACSEKKQTDKEVLDSAIASLPGTDFGAAWQDTVRALEEIKDPKRQSPAPAALAAEARYWLARSQMALFFTALITEDEELFTMWQTLRGWKLTGKISDLVNFQATLQEIISDFQRCSTEEALTQELRTSSEILAQYGRIAQGIFYRDKSHYLKGTRQIRSNAELAWLDDAMAIRDLLVETTRRPGPGMEANWQNVVLTVVGRVCPTIAPRHVSGVCTLVDLATAEEFCPQDWNKQNEGTRVAGAVLLMTQCASDMSGAETLSGIDAIRFYYDASYERLTSSKEAPAQLVAWAKAHREDMATAYKQLEDVLFMKMTRADLDKIDEQKMMESLVPKKKGELPSMPLKKAPTNRPKPPPVHLHHHHGHGHDHGDEPGTDQGGDHEHGPECNH